MTLNPINKSPLGQEHEVHPFPKQDQGVTPIVDRQV